MGPSNSAPEPTPRRRPGREARPAEDRQRDRTEGAKAACEGCGYLEGGQVARDRDWHGAAHLKGASNEPARGGAMSRGKPPAPLVRPKGCTARVKSRGRPSFDHSGASGHIEPAMRVGVEGTEARV